MPQGIWGYSSAGRAPALQAGGHRFDSDYLHQERQAQIEVFWKEHFNLLLKKNRDLHLEN